MLNDLKPCEICGREVEYGLMFGSRCIGCQRVGFEIWGFGEKCEEERNKEPLESQKAKIFKKYSEIAGKAINLKC